MNNVSKITVLVVVLVLSGISVKNLLHFKKDSLGNTGFVEKFKAFSTPLKGLVKGNEKWLGDTTKPITARTTLDIEADQVTKDTNTSIQSHSHEAQRNDLWYFIITILTTVLTAAAALISTIQAFKKGTPNPGNAQLFMILIATATFCSTVANCFGTHFSSKKTEHTKKVSDLMSAETKFISDYASADTEKKQRTAITTLRATLVETN